MSSQLNPRDYDLGELRDAVRETTRRERNDDHARDEGLDDDRPPESDDQPANSADRPTNSDHRQPDQRADGQSHERDATKAAQRRSDDGRNEPERRTRREAEPTEYQPASQRRPGETAAAEYGSGEENAGGEQSQPAGGETEPGTFADAETEADDALTDAASDDAEDDFDASGDDFDASTLDSTQTQTAAQPSEGQSVSSASAESSAFESAVEAEDRDETAGIADDPAAYLRSRHEKRRAAGRDPETGPDTGRSDPAIEQEDFELLARLSENSDDRPYLSHLPDEYSAQLEIFDWLDGMLAKAGHESTVEALEYYESVGWLSEESRSQLEDFADGLAASDAGGHPLTVADHRESLLYIARLSHRLRQ